MFSFIFRVNASGEKFKKFKSLPYLFPCDKTVEELVKLYDVSSSPMTSTSHYHVKN